MITLSFDAEHADLLRKALARYAGRLKRKIKNAETEDRARKLSSTRRRVLHMKAVVEEEVSAALDEADIRHGDDCVDSAAALSAIAGNRLPGDAPPKGDA